METLHYQNVANHQTKATEGLLGWDLVDQSTAHASRTQKIPKSTSVYRDDKPKSNLTLITDL